MRILLGSAYFEGHRGGIEIVAGRLARELTRLGAEVTWLAAASSPPPAAGWSGGATLPICAWNVTERRFGVPLPLPAPAAVATIHRAVRNADALVLNDALYPSNIVAALAARWYGKPVVLVQHIGKVPYRNPLLRRAMAAANALVALPMLAAADQVVFISETVQRHFEGVRFKAQPRIVFNGVDTGLFTPPDADFDRPAARRALGLPPHDDVVLFVGRFVEKKGLHVVERLARRAPHRTFALAGWGPIDPRTWRLPNVVVLDGLSGASLVPLYRASDALVLPSIGEGLPLVIQEALACGLPVLCGAETARADGRLAKLVEGIQIDMSDPDTTAATFALGIDRVLGKGRGDSNSAATRHAFAVARYSWGSAAQAYLDVIQRLISAPAAAVDANTSLTR